jgi:hypothetical protein
MIALEGRVLAGLDEFMLRLGHLKVLASVGVEVGGNWSRIEREFASFLTSQVSVPEDGLASLASYLLQKRLCPSALEIASSQHREEYRYPDLIVGLDQAGRAIIQNPVGPVRVWRQDLWLSDPQVTSKVGAVTVNAKSRSKTGVSHIRDWATIIDLFSASGQLAAEGHLALKLEQDAEGESWKRNPYVLNGERLIFAYLIWSADIDVFSRFVPRLLHSQFPLRKAEATEVFTSAIRDLSDHAEGSRSLSAPRQYRLLHSLRELQGNPRPGSPKSTTIWHRTASRLESMVDLGLLDKGSGGESERYEYTYYPTPALSRCADSLGRSTTAEGWIEDHLASVIFDTDPISELLDPTEVYPLLRRITPCLGRPISLVPIVPLALGISWLLALQSRPITILAARNSIESFARAHPELARLSRGSSGSRAEFISLLARADRN